MSQNCKCDKCRAACEHRAGWFLPDEIKQAAQKLGMTEKEFFDRYLGVDWYVGWDDTFILAPAIGTMKPGSEYPGDPKGKCIFFKDGLCTIHSVKPFECREYYHTDTSKIVDKRHKFVAKQWEAHQDYITELLGEEPIAEEYYAFGFFE